MDDLNRPLGQKPEPREKPVRKLSAGHWLGLAGLLTGLVAIGLVSWQLLNPPKETVIASGAPSAETIPADDDGVETAEGSSEDAGQGEEGDPGDEFEEGETGLVELKSQGSIAVPKPRPPRAKPQEAATAHFPDSDLLERGATGSIPKRSEDGRRAMDVYAREPDTTGNFGVARVVLIVGGMGVSQSATQQAIKMLPPSVVLAFAPYGNSLDRWMQAARKDGHELLLQLPMEPFGYPQNSPGPRTLVSNVSDDENIANLHWAMSRITNYVGVMNYQGAKILAEPDALKPIFDEIADRGLLFVDDGSASGSRSKLAAARSILPYASAHIQIDSKRTRQDIAKQVEALVAEAKRTGLAIGFSNGFPETISMLAEFAGKANQIGVEITPVSAIVTDPERDG